MLDHPSPPGQGCVFQGVDTVIDPLPDMELDRIGDRFQTLLGITGYGFAPLRLPAEQGAPQGAEPADHHHHEGRRDDQAVDRQSLGGVERGAGSAAGDRADLRGVATPHLLERVRDLADRRLAMEVQGELGDRTVDLQRELGMACERGSDRDHGQRHVADE